jgi:hypothetical protein
MIRRLILVAVIALMQWAVPTVLWGQTDSLNAATLYYSKKEFYKAKTAIDGASNDPSTMNMPYTWYMRAFIYKEIYRNYESGDKMSKAREEAVKSFAKLIPMDSINEYPEARQALKALAITYFNQSKEFFTPDQYKTAIQYFENYEKYARIADPRISTKEPFINFYQSLATVLNNALEVDRKKYLPLMEEIDNCYKKILSQDSTDAFSWKNISLLYYNHGVSVISEMDPDRDFFEIDQIQDKAKEFFKKALPYGLKAHKFKPDDKAIVQMLENIYHALYDEENAAKMHALLEKLNGGK